MATTPTQLPVPSEKPQDLKFNSGKIDEVVTSMGWTYTDRFGNKHYTIEGINYLAQQVMNAFGYITLNGVDFDTGATVSTPNEVLFNPDDNSYYKWTGSYSSGPKIVPEDSTPQSAGGIGPGKWLNVGDTALRSELAATGGDKLVGSSYGGSVYSDYQRDKFIKFGEFGSAASINNNYTALRYSADGMWYVSKSTSFPVAPPASPDSTWQCVGLLNGHPVNDIRNWGGLVIADATAAAKLALSNIDSLLIPNGSFVFTDTIFSGGKSVRIYGESKSAVVVNNCPDDVWLINFPEVVDTSYSSEIYGFSYVSTTYKNGFYKHSLSVLSVDVHDIDITGGHKVFSLSKLYGNPRIRNIHVRNLAWDSTNGMAGSFFLSGSSCNTLSIEKVSVTGAYDDGIYLVQDSSNNENWSNSISNVTIQGRGDTEQYGLKNAINITGGSVMIGNFYTEKNRPSNNYPLYFNNSNVNLSMPHLSSGSMYFTNCIAVIESPDFIKQSGGVEGVSHLRSSNSNIVINQINNYGDYNFRFESANSGAITVSGSNVDAKTNPAKTPVNAGVFGLNSVITDLTSLVAAGMTGAVHVSVTGNAATDQAGIRFAIPSTTDAAFYGMKYTMAFRVKLNLGARVSSRQIATFSSPYSAIPYVSYQDKTGEWLDLVFHGVIPSTGVGAACAVVLTGNGNFDIVPTAYFGHISP